MSSQGAQDVAALANRLTVVETKQSERHPIIDGRLASLESVIPMTAVRLGGLEQSVVAMAGQVREQREDQKTSIKAIRDLEVCVRRLERNGQGEHVGHLARVAPMVTTGGVAGTIVSAVLVVLEMMR